MDVDPPTLRYELDRVREEVGHDLLQPGRVATNADAERRQVAPEDDALRLRRGTRLLDGDLDDRRQVDHPELERQLAGGDARDVEQILDQADLEPRIALDALERTGRLLGVERARP